MVGMHFLRVYVVMFLESMEREERLEEVFSGQEPHLMGFALKPSLSHVIRGGPVTASHCNVNNGVLNANKHK